MSYNAVILVGHVGKDPEVKTTGSGKSVASFSLATSRGFGDSKKTEWHNIVVWEKLAESVPKFAKKGALLVVRGRIETRSWDDQASGKKQYRTEIIAEDVQRLDSRSEGASGSSSGPAPAQARAAAAPARPAPARAAAPAPARPAAQDDGFGITDDDIDF